MPIQIYCITGLGIEHVAEGEKVLGRFSLSFDLESNRPTEAIRDIRRSKHTRQKTVRRGFFPLLQFQVLPWSLLLLWERANKIQLS